MLLPTPRDTAETTPLWIEHDQDQAGSGRPRPYTGGVRVTERRRHRRTRRPGSGVNAPFPQPCPLNWHTVPIERATWGGAVGIQQHAVALDRALAAQFGDDWRVFPYSGEWTPTTRINDETVGWLALRRAIAERAEELGLAVNDIPAMCELMVSLLAPRDLELDLDPLAIRAVEFVHAVSKDQPSKALAAVDAVLTLVATSDEALALAHREPGTQAVDQAKTWTTANNMTKAIIAQQLARVAKVLVTWHGEGVLGHLAADTGSFELGERLRSEYFHDLAPTYLDWQQNRICGCRPDGRCQPEKAPKHHLHRWEHGGSAAHDLSIWIGTWVCAQQGKGVRKPKALEAGLFCRHTLRQVSGAAVTIVFGETLGEVCITEGCAGRGELAHKKTASDPAAMGANGHRLCLFGHIENQDPTRDPAERKDHELDFASGKRHRPLIVLDANGPRTTHEWVGQFSWDEAVSRWRLVEKGSDRWLPLPREGAHARLLARGGDLRPGRSKEGATTALGDGSTLDGATMAESAVCDLVRSTLADIEAESDRDAEAVQSTIGTALMQTGRVSRRPPCDVCDCGGVPGEGTAFPFCLGDVEEIVVACLTGQRLPDFPIEDQHE